MIKVLVCLLSLPIAAFAACPDYSAIENAPQLTSPTKQSFHHIKSRLVSMVYQPWHMVHDQIAQVGQAIQVTAKFDYGMASHKDLEDETVQAYLSGTGIDGWESLGEFTSNDDGKVTVNAGQRPIGEYRIRFVVAGDLSTVDGFVSVVEAGQKAVLFDVDGTLTTTDFEAYKDYVGLKTATPYANAINMVNAYKSKGYQIIYLTARPYWVTKDAREWFAKMGIPTGHYRSNDYAGLVPPNTQAHKTEYVRYLKNTVGLDIVRAYGNALTDIAAYADGGIAKKDTWIIGVNAGKNDTQAINTDYTAHYHDMVITTPLVKNCSL